MKIYVIIPIYNEASFLEKSINSFVNQTVIPKKVIYVDDNSTDSSKNIVSKYSQKFDWIELIQIESTSQHIPGSKIINAFNKGLKSLDNDYDIVCKFDGDIILPTNYFEKLNGLQKDGFRFIQISTDEVYGSLKKNEPQSIEESPYFPNSPYSASKASGDHLARAWYKTYGFPVITSNCTNNYGPFQHEEKLIPLMISFCLQGKKLPVYGNGSNIRDWLYVKDHCEALSLILESGKTGETYNIGGQNELKNLEVVNKICNILNSISPKKDGKSYLDQITFVEDRLGHDYRYGLNISKIKSHLGWSPKENFDSGLKKTIEWYLKINDVHKR